MELDAVQRHLEDELGELAADAVQPLPGQLEVHRVGRGIVARDAGARLDRHHDDAVVHHLDGDDMGGVLHRLRHGIVVALLEMEGEIARRLVPERRRAVRKSRHAVDDGRQRLVVDLDQLGRLARRLDAVGDDEGHRIADMAHAAIGQRRPRRHDQRLHRRQAGQGTESVGREIGRGGDEMHAGERRGRRQRRSA